MKCWAKNVSPCCSTQSGEHYITKGLFADKMVRVENAPFLGGQSKVISKASLTRNCLCKRHNELLSIYDDEAIRFGEALKYCQQLSAKRRNQKSKSFSVHRKYVNRDLFCRWYVKTFIGLIEFFKYPSVLDVDILAELVYSNEKIGKYVDLSFSMAMNEEFSIIEKVDIAPLEKNEQTLGMQISIYGVRVNGIFSDKPNFKNEPMKINFKEHRKVLSCVVQVQ